MKTVLVTGASRGMGLGYVRHYLREGWRVATTSRSLEQARVLQELAQQDGVRLTCADLDVSCEHSIAKLAKELAGQTLDLVINNAGYSRQEVFGKWSTSTFEDHLRVNAIGPALVAQSVVQRMLEGSILVNISSGMGSLTMSLNPEDGLDAYAASKAALNMLTLRLAAKLRQRGIVVVSVNPGWVRTSMGGADAPTPIDQTVANITKLIDRLTLEHSGKFFSDEGEEIPW